MTIVVMFGIFEKLGLTGVSYNPAKYKATHFDGDNDDQFWIIEDKDYTSEGLPNDFPQVNEETPLGVILHNGSEPLHANQLKWLEKKSKFRPDKAWGFSHPVTGSIADTIREWASYPPSKEIVSKTVREYGCIIRLRLLDELAAWHLLAMASGSPDIYSMRQEVLDRGRHFVDHLSLIDTDPGEWLDLLEVEASKFCN